MAAAAGRVVALLAVLVAAAVHGEAAPSVVVGLAKCAACTRKNMKAEDAFKSLRVAIKCRNGAGGEYETRAAGGLDGAGAFSVPLAGDLRGADCVAQLHSAATDAPCPGQEPSRVMPLSEGTFVAVAGKTHHASPECASATICEPIKKHFLDHFHHKAPAAPAIVKPAPKPHPDPHPEPQPHPTPTPTYGSTPSPYHPPAKN
ncbi:uncharacterized protein LOC102705565 [Oryza brachyantha]|uniref:Proline-rich protein n=1 Tax=Oryza brachyantha TaxID=4533 RepID=J3N0Y2_ORYBR|nr:uncharacterized protein LOC102705565 [Oryza brachyantha]